VKLNIRYQDNTSTMKLEMNNETSFEKRTRHFDIKLLCHNLVKKKEVTNEYCPMDEKCFTKLLVGNKFGKDNKKIMNNTSIQWDSSSVLK